MPKPTIIAKANRHPEPSRQAPSAVAQVWHAMTDMVRRIAALESRPVPSNGVGVESAIINRDGVLVITRSDGKSIEAGHVVGRDGVVDDAAIARMIDDRVSAAVAGLARPAPEEIVSIDPAEVAKMVSAEVERVLATWARPEDGKSVKIDDVEPMLARMVDMAFAGIQPPKGIESIDVDRIDEETAVLRIVVDKTAHSFEIGLPRGIQGPGIEPEALRQIVDASIGAVIGEHVEKAVAALPKAEDGVSVVDTIVNGDGRLMVILSDNRRVDAGKVIPDVQPGTPGRSVASAAISDDDNLVLTMSDGEEIEVGRVKGEPGESVAGDPGRGIAALNRDGDDLVATFTDGEIVNLGRIKGDPGKPGKAGAKVKGDPGATLSLINFTPADLSASDLDALYFADIELSDGTTLRVITKN